MSSSALPPCIELTMRHRAETKWDPTPKVSAGNITVHCGPSPYSAVDSVKVTALMPDLSPSTVMCVYAWNERDSFDMSAPMNAVDELRVRMDHFGRVADDATKAKLQTLVQQRGGEKKFAQDKKQMPWQAAAGLPAPGDRESLWRSVSKSPMPLVVSPRDWVWRKEPPLLLTAAQKSALGFGTDGKSQGEVWVTGMLPGEGVPKQKGHERAVGFRWGVTAEAVENGATRLILTASFDMGGSMPAVILNSVNKRMADFVARIEKQARRIKAANGGKEMRPQEFLKRPLRLAKL